jgi:hypothetical protein
LTEQSVSLTAKARRPGTSSEPASSSTTSPDIAASRASARSVSGGSGSRMAASPRSLIGLPIEPPT